MIKRSFIKVLLISAIIFVGGCDAPTHERPKVLIIGDSISIGYTPYVQRSLDSRAQVMHSQGNAQDSNNGIRNLEAWVGSQKWDVISFNFGLWDICYRRPGPITQENRDKVNGIMAVPLNQYEKNLYVIASRLKATGANVIFQNITVVPSNEPGRNSSDVYRYNQVAASVMARLDIPVNDLQSVTAGLADGMRESGTDVHYTESGYAEIAKSVTRSIEAAL